MSEALERGRAALAAADWPAAKVALEDALADGGTDARESLGFALWWLGDVHGAVAAWEKAYAEWVAAGEPCRAAKIALKLATEYSGAWGNAAVSNGWEARAERLLAEVGPCDAHVELALRRARREKDPAVAATRASEAMSIAKTVGARDLEFFALATKGRWLVSSGSADEGFAMLDEAMAAVAGGEVADHWVEADISCTMLVACDRANDLARATDWCRVVEDLMRRRGCRPVFAFCRASYAGVLFARGRWSEAEDELVDAVKRYEETHPAACAVAVGRLTEIRVARGELDAAHTDLEPFYDHPACTFGAAALDRARGNLDVAASRLERRISVVDPDASLLAPLWDALADVHMARGDRKSAEDSGSRLRAIADHQNSRVLHAMSEATLGALAVERQTEEATARLSRAHEVYVEMAMPYRAARVQLHLARALADKRREAAIATARRAHATFETLGATPCAELAADLLRTLSGARPVTKRRAGIDALTKREREVADLVAEGCSNAEIGKRLEISAKTAEHHVCSVLAKLDLKSRASIAAWAARTKKSDP